ncbi:hypothetical protein FB451DRAFT_1238714 [Mycena latifolia]|nr:hypothetical protein FB451DRAFT_1238714 [Mycena latifolia]
MAASIPGPTPTFPEDIERAINEEVLNNYRDMCGTVSLVASRFREWTKPVTFHTVVLRPHNNWMERIRDVFLPNASFIRCLAITVRQIQGPLSDEELTYVRRLLEASNHVKHFAVVWSIWAHHHRECGALQLESLYLIWDKKHHIPPPSLKNLQHPSTLNDLTVDAPADLNNMITWRPWGELYIPDTRQCVNLAYVTYAANTLPGGSLTFFCDDSEFPAIRGVMFVLVDIPEKLKNEAQDSELMKDEEEFYPNFSTTYLPNSWQLLNEWLEKMEGRPSVFQHPPPHEVEPWDSR